MDIYEKKKGYEEEGGEREREREGARGRGRGGIGVGCQWQRGETGRFLRGSNGR